MNLQEFINTYLGKRVDPNGEDRGHYQCFNDNKFPWCHQCVSLVQWYVQVVWEKTRPYWDAKRLVTNLSRKEYDVIFPSSGQKPQSGDIISFWAVAGNPYGHIGIVVSLTHEGFKMLEQNGWSGDGYGEGNNAIRIVSKSYNNVVAWARPKNLNNPLSRKNIASRIFKSLAWGEQKNGKTAWDIWSGTNPDNIATRYEVVQMIKNYFAKVFGRSIDETRIWNRDRPNDMVSEYELGIMIGRAGSI